MKSQPILHYLMSTLHYLMSNNTIIISIITLSNVYKWAESNNMKFNSKKFQYINYTVSPQCNTSNVYVSADSNLIDPSHTVKDLGVLMSNDCMFDDHICQVTKKCSQLCGWILRTFENRSELLMLTFSGKF